MSNEMVKTEISGFAFNPANLDEAMKCCTMLSQSEMVPKDYKGKPANILVAIQMGLEVGLKPLQSLQNIAVVNGRPCLWGDAIVAIVRASGTVEYLDETWDDKLQAAICKGKRKGEPTEIVRVFSIADATKAGLIQRAGSEGTWAKYPKRMCSWRAKSWVLRDGWSDYLKGISIREEVEDLETNVHVPVEPLRLSASVPMPDLVAFAATNKVQNGTISEPARKSESPEEKQEPNVDGAISDAQRKRLYAILVAGSKDTETRKAREEALKAYLIEMYQIDSTTKICWKDYDKICTVADEIAKG